jgi:L-ascorbate metabolism protein UlaG (beta-lactamase superfamily)
MIGRSLSSSGSDDERERGLRSPDRVPPEAAHRAQCRVPSTGLALVWLGHSSVSIELDGIRLLTDPVLRDRIAHLTRIVPPIAPTEVGAVDCVLLSHLHADHTDIPTLRALDRHGPILAPTPAAPWLVDRGLDSIRELAAGERHEVGSVSITALPAEHAGRRWPRGPEAATLGYLARGSSAVYFAGDTDLFDAMAELRGSVDVALLPVWGWGRGVGPGHLDPERAAAAAALIEPAVAIPIHWGTYALPRPLRAAGDPAAPARKFAELVQQRAPGIEVRLLSPGGRTEL